MASYVVSNRANGVALRPKARLKHPVFRLINCLWELDSAYFYRSFQAGKHCSGDGSSRHPRRCAPGKDHTRTIPETERPPWWTFPGLGFLGPQTDSGTYSDQVASGQNHQSQANQKIQVRLTILCRYPEPPHGSDHQSVGWPGCTSRF